MAESSSWKRVSDTSLAGTCGRRWCQYRPLTIAAGSSLTASQVWVRYPISKSSGAPGPPIFVGTQPGSTALLRTSRHRRATAEASAVTYSLLSEYAWLEFQRCNVLVGKVRCVEHDMGHGHRMNRHVRRPDRAHDRRDHVRQAGLLGGSIRLVPVTPLNHGFQIGSAHSLCAQRCRVHDHFQLRLRSHSVVAERNVDVVAEIG